VALALVFAAVLPAGGWLPLGVFALASASDYVDGPLARRAGGPSRHGVLLDAGADVTFVLVASLAGVAIGRVWRLVPVAIACAAIPFLVASMRRSRAAGRPTRAYSAVGHAAGVCNYALVGLVAGSVALPGTVWPPILWCINALVLALNATAVALRLRPSRW